MPRRILITLAGILGVMLIYRQLSRRFSLPCPTWLSGTVEGKGTWGERLLGTQTTLDRIGLRPGQRVLEVGPGTGRLLVPAARRVSPGGAAVGLDIQLRMLKRLEEDAAREGVSNLTTVLGDAA